MHIVGEMHTPLHTRTPLPITPHAIWGSAHNMVVILIACSAVAFILLSPTAESNEVVQTLSTVILATPCLARPLLPNVPVREYIAASTTISLIVMNLDWCS
jgi:hypothetical protein